MSSAHVIHVLSSTWDGYTAFRDPVPSDLNSHEVTGHWALGSALIYNLVRAAVTS